LAIHDDKYPLIYRGLVMDNNDPSQYGRIKVQIYPMFADITDATLLPWAVPAMPIFDGAGTGSGSFAVPKINTFVFVFFEQGDFYQPVYFAEAQTAQKGLPSARTTNYPNRKVIRTSGGIEIFIDDTSKEIKLTHPTGTTIDIATDGSLTITDVKDIGVTATGNITITGATVSINPV
jgi:uncharacterized protein involved in type VI secretion and phage assembly